MKGNLQDRNVGNLGDILKHATLVQLAKIFADNIPASKYYLDSHSYLYQSRLINPDWKLQVDELREKSKLYFDYIKLERPFVKKGEYLCSSGLVNRLIPDAHLLLCESNKFTREWLLQQLADNKVEYHTVKPQLVSWAKGKPVKKLPNLLVLIDPFELTDELWKSANKCLRKMLAAKASVIMLVFDYSKQVQRDWPQTPKDWLVQAGSLAMPPYHLAVYASEDLLQEVEPVLGQLGWHTPAN